MPSLYEITIDRARYVVDSGYDVEIADGIDHEFISIYDTATNEPVFTLRYDEYDSYRCIMDCLARSLANEGRTVDEQTLLRANATSYIDCL